MKRQVARRSPSIERVVEVIGFDTGSYARTLSEWAKEYDLPVRLVCDRYESGLRGTTLVMPTANDIIDCDICKRLWGTWRFVGKPKIQKYFRENYKWVYVGKKQTNENTVKN